jgi:hypothetical protein
MMITKLGRPWSMNPSLDTEIYIDGDIDLAGLEEFVAEVAAGIARGTFGDDTRWYDFIHVARNKEYQPIADRVPGDEFLFSMYILDVGPSATIDAEVFKQCVATLLEMIWAASYSATTACHFEDELPFEGSRTF